MVGCFDGMKIENRLLYGYKYTSVLAMLTIYYTYQKKTERGLPWKDTSSSQNHDSEDIGWNFRKDHKLYDSNSLNKELWLYLRHQCINSTGIFPVSVAILCQHTEIHHKTSLSYMHTHMQWQLQCVYLLDYILPYYMSSWSATVYVAFEDSYINVLLYAESNCLLTDT